MKNDDFVAAAAALFSTATERDHFDEGEIN
jgi:hypothetical protein